MPNYDIYSYLIELILCLPNLRFLIILIILQYDKVNFIKVHYIMYQVIAPVLWIGIGIFRSPLHIVKGLKNPKSHLLVCEGATNIC